MPSLTSAPGTIRCKQTKTERRHQSILAEIIDVARAQLKTQEALSISSIAASLGMTPPALYRYVHNLTELSDLTNRAIILDVHELVQAAADRQTESAARLAAAVTAFRQWSLNNYAEYRAAFAPQRGPLIRSERDLSPSAELACNTFGDLTVAVLERYSHEIVAEIRLHSSYRERHDRFQKRFPNLALSQSAEILWLFEQLWIQLLGIISYEVYGFLDPELVASGDVSIAVLCQVARSLGLSDELERLLAISIETATWADAQFCSQPLHIQLQTHDSTNLKK